MTRSEYIERVLAVMRRVTPDERFDIRTELDAHMEDHICALMELGYEESLAEERTMARMGDPEEVGRELDKQYPMHWLIIGRIALLVTVVMCITALTGLGILFHFRDSVVARIAPEAAELDDLKIETISERDLKVSIGNDILKVYCVAIAEDRIWPTDDYGPAAVVFTCVYDRIPGGIASVDVQRYVTAMDQRGKAVENLGGGSGSWGAEYRRYWVPIQPDDTYVTLHYDRFDEVVSLHVPLPEVAS